MESVKQMQKIEPTIRLTCPGSKTITFTNMTKLTHRKKRSKLTIALLAPILAIAFIVSWSISWIGQPKAKQPQKPISN
jgi:hypothetical protein